MWLLWSGGEPPGARGIAQDKYSVGERAESRKSLCENNCPLKQRQFLLRLFLFTVILYIDREKESSRIKYSIDDNEYNAIFAQEITGAVKRHVYLSEHKQRPLF